MQLDIAEASWELLRAPAGVSSNWAGTCPFLSVLIVAMHGALLTADPKRGDLRSRPGFQIVMRALILSCAGPRRCARTQEVSDEWKSRQTA